MVGAPDTSMVKIFFSVLITATFVVDIKAYNIVLQLPNFNETENLTVIEDYNYLENTNNTSSGNATDYFYIDYPKIGYQIFKNKMAEAMEIYESFMNKNPVILKVDRTDLSNNATINLTILNNNITDKVYQSFSDMQQNLETNTESPLEVNLTEVFEITEPHFLESINFTQSHRNYSFPVLETSLANQTASNKINKTMYNEEIVTVNYNGNNTASVEAINEANKTVSNEGNRTSSDEANKTFSDETNKTVSSEGNRTYNNYEGNRTSSDEANKTLSDETNKTVSNEGNRTASEGVEKAEVAPVGFFGKVSNTITNIYHSLTSWF